MHAASRHGDPNLASLPKDGEVSCEVRPSRLPIQNLTLLDWAQLQSPDENCMSRSAIHPEVFAWAIKSIIVNKNYCCSVSIKRIGAVQSSRDSPNGPKKESQIQSC